MMLVFFMLGLRAPGRCRVSLLWERWEVADAYGCVSCSWSVKLWLSAWRGSAVKPTARVHGRCRVGCEAAPNEHDKRSHWCSENRRREDCGGVAGGDGGKGSRPTRNGSGGVWWSGTD